MPRHSRFAHGGSPAPSCPVRSRLHQRLPEDLRSVPSAGLVITAAAALVALESARTVLLLVAHYRRPPASPERAGGEGGGAAARAVRYWTLLDEQIHGGGSRKVAASPTALTEGAVAEDRQGLSLSAGGDGSDDGRKTEEEEEEEEAMGCVLVPPRDDCFPATGNKSEAWDGLLLLWTDAARYRVDVDHITPLLAALGPAELRAALGTPGEAADAVAVAVVCLVLVWRLQRLRRMYRALVLFHDAQRCREDCEALAEARAHYSGLLLPLSAYLAGRPVGCGCAPLACWRSLQQCEAFLHGLERGLNRQHVRCLLRYLYASRLGGAGGVRDSRLASEVVLCGLTTIAAKVTACGARARDRLHDLLPLALCLALESGCCGAAASRPGGLPVLRRIALLCALEVARHTAHAFLKRCTHELVQLAAQRRRDASKAQLYAALARLPLCFYDMHSADEVELMVYYVNDLEGVDVLLHNFLLNLLSAALAVRERLSSLECSDRRAAAAVAVAVCSVGASYGLQSVVAAVSRAYQARRRDGRLPAWLRTAAADEDCQESENCSPRGAMLGGLDIIARVSALRPHGADVRLVDEWNARVYGAGAGTETGGVWRTVASHYGTLVPSVCGGLAELLAWLLPLAFASLGAALLSPGQDEGAAERRRRLLCTLSGLADSLRGLLEGATDWGRVRDVLLLNAHKASVLERLQSPAVWEPRSADGTAAAGAAAAVSSLQSVHLHRLSFRYPSTPTVSVFGAPLTLDVLLSDRLVALVGPSGCGKSTLLTLLLRLYECAGIELGFVGGRRARLGDVPCDVLRGRLLRFVPQQPTLIPGASLAQNVSLSNEVSLEDTATLARVEECCRLARCWDLVERLPQQLLTAVAAQNDAGAAGGAEGVCRVSGGQAQRLMVARALFPRAGGAPPVLLMDEPTASLDAAATAEIVLLVRSLLASGAVAGVLCATHDESLMSAADELISLHAS